MNQLFALALRIGVAAALSLSIPLQASDASQAVSITCATVAACALGINTAAGIGVEGMSTRGIGVAGASTSGIALNGASKTNGGVVGHTAQNATSQANGKAGVTGFDDSTNKNHFNSGVLGVSQYSSAVAGRSTYGAGVLALSTQRGNALEASAGAALYSGFANAGVVAQSALGDGVIGVGNTTGVVGFATYNCNSGPFCSNPLQNEIPSGGALTAGTDAGGLGLNIYTDANPNGLIFPQGVGATISSGTLGLMITPDRGDYGDAGLVVAGSLAPRDTTTGFQGAVITGANALSVTGGIYGIAVTADIAVFAQGSLPGSTLFRGAASNGTTVAQLNDSGNLTIAGKLTQRGTFTTALRNVDGTYSAAYGTHTTIPAVDDMGEANLVSGIAFVPIDPALAKSIDVSRGYLVFLTPQGATTGLYVIGKSRLGFSVREIGNARDSIAFDYRIVAHPYGEYGQRLAPLGELITPAVSRKPLFYRNIKPLQFIHGKLDRNSVPKPSF